MLKRFHNQLESAEADLNHLADTHTNIPKLKAGFVGGQVRLGRPCIPFGWGSISPLPGALAKMRPSLAAAHPISWGCGAAEGARTATQARDCFQNWRGASPTFLGPWRVGPRGLGF